MADELFKTAPKEVVDYFDRRASRPSARWDELAPREHALAFTAARTAGFDVIDDLRAATRAAVVDRIPFEEFRRQLEPSLRAKGWWGRAETVDSRTGEVGRVMLGSPGRLQLIYDANIRSAEAAGDWIRIQRVKDVLPYLEYMTSVSERKRPLHLTWVGTTLPVDDSWWATHYPPNGWRCKCRVRSRAAPREDASTRRPPLDLRTVVNKTTGEKRQVPAGIDPGWEHNPGTVREQMTGKRLAERLDRMSTPARAEAVKRLRKDPVHDYVVRNEAGFDPARPSDPDQQDLGRLRWPVATLPDRMAAQLGTNSRTVSLTVADAAKIATKHGLTPAQFGELDELLTTPERVELGDNGKLMVEGRIAGKLRRAIIKLTSLGELLLNSYHFRQDRRKRGN